MDMALTRKVRIDESKTFMLSVDANHMEIGRRCFVFHLRVHGFVAAALLLASCQRPPTFNREIAPIVFKNCAPCHRPGEAGPFPLLNYEDVVKKAKTIAAVTQGRYMPPWPADPSYSHFIGERVLRDDEIQAIKRWVENGTPEGDPANRPP